MLWIDKERPFLVVGDVFRHHFNGEPVVLALMVDGTIAWIDAPLSCFSRPWWTITLKEDSQ